MALFVLLLDTFWVLVGGSGRGKTLMHSSVSESMSGLYTKRLFPADLLLGEGWAAVVGAAGAEG
jgi:hypothetical protein